MKVVTSSDWRDAIEFETPVVVADVAPGEPTRCFVCGNESELRDRADLWAVKHRHPNDHAGFVRFYCNEHRPEVPPPAPVVVEVQRPAPRQRRTTPAAPKPTHPNDRVRAMCPDCYVEISATGECGMCGKNVV